jgi:UDP-glucose 4-epimerase
LSNAYGAPVHPRIDRWTLVFNDLCRQAVVSGEIVLATAGGQHRDFITLHDVGRAVVHALRSDAVMHDGEVFNLGGRTSLSIREVAAIVARVAENELGAPIPVRGPEGRVTGARVNYDITKFEATGFRLSGSMEQEIVATLALCRRAVEEGSWMPAARES